MQVSSAILCDAASVREGLLFVMGGGVTRLWRESFPAPLGVELAVVLELRQTELPRPHEVEVVIIGEDGQRVAEAKGGIQVREQDLDVGETLLVPMVIPLRNVPIPIEGRYSCDILVNGNHERTISFAARPRPQAQ